MDHPTGPDTDADIGAYAKSKTLAERAAWEAANGGNMEMTVINPGAVFGPSLGAALDGQSVTDDEQIDHRENFHDPCTWPWVWLMCGMWPSFM